MSQSFAARNRIHPVILSGGSGTRLWPLSRENHAKQFQALISNRSLLQETVLRFRDTSKFAAPVVVSGIEPRFLILQHLEEIGVTPDALLLEPAPRNTAPAVALAALLFERQGLGEHLMLVLPADHAISEVPAFLNGVETGVMHAEAGRLVTFGIVPTHPETGFGYIQTGAPLDERPYPALTIDAFVEKPDRARAELFFESGTHLWNGGIFLFRADSFLAELERFRPDILAACRAAMAGGRPDLAFFRIDEAAFRSCPSDSIDYAVMERTGKGAVVPIEAGWSDIGSWASLWELGQKDGAGNVLIGDVLNRETSNCYLRAEHSLLAAVGVEDLIVVESGDVVLVAPKARSQEVKELVAELKQRKRPEAETHRRVHRPWGWYETVDEGERFQVKHLMVKPGHKLSLQMHHHRAEHWVVVSGTARVQVDQREVLLSENESTYIPIGAMHRLENPGKVPLRLVEVQSGCYLGEDDIVRFDDTYGRLVST